MSNSNVRQVYSGRVIKLNVESLTLPNGRPAQLEIVRHPGAAAIVPLTEHGTVLLIRQYRYAAGGFVYEIPAGSLDAGEPPQRCAERELLEEAGVTARHWITLGSILTTPGFTDEVIHLFLARDLERGEQHLENDEVLTVEEFRFSETLEMCRDGRLQDAKSMCALMRTQMHLAAGEPDS